MARYKKISWEETQHKRDKKRERIYTLVTFLWSAVMIAAICLGGAFQNNDKLVGLVLFVIGVLDALYCTFVFITRRREWQILTMYDSDELYQHKHTISKEIVEREKRHTNGWMTALTVAIAVKAIVCAIWGITKLT